MPRLRAIVLTLSFAALGCSRGPAPATSPPPPPDGAALYARHCAACHGESGAGDGPMAVYFSPVPRDFTTGKFAYRSTGPTGLPSDDDLVRTVAEGLRWSSMPPFGEELSEAEIRAVVEEVKRLSGRPDEDGKWHNHFVEHPDRTPLAVSPSPPRTRELMDRGAALYSGDGSFCVNCHGPEGAGDGTSTEWLVDSEGRSIQPRDLRNPIYQRGATARDIFLRIRCGIPGTPMPSMSKNVPDADVWALAWHVRSLQRIPASFVERGRLLYRAHGCADCHGEDLVAIPNPGAKDEWITPLGGLAERLGLRSAAEADRVIAVLRDGKHLHAAGLGNAPAVAQALERVRRAVREGRDAVPEIPDGDPPALRRMPGWGDRLAPRDIDAVIAYLLTLQLWVPGEEPEPPTGR